MAKFFGIDYGLERVGLAITDPDGRMAFPLATLTLKQFGRRAALLDALCARAVAENADKIVIGLPLSGDGGENQTCRQVRNIVSRIQRRLSIPIYFMPEYLSSQEAEDDLRAAGMKGKNIKKALDQQAACRILSSFLNLPESSRMPA